MGITIRGKAGGGFEIEIAPMSAYREAKADIVEKLAKNKAFFTGAQAKLIITGKELTKAQKSDLKRLLSMDYDIENVDFRGSLAEQQNEVKVRQAKPADEPPAGSRQIKLISKDYFNAKSIFVSHTLRSGQRVECAGDVIVLGDVNDGAEVIAGGSIAVMGTLRGLVHAGATGRSDVVVAANMLVPKQLRISGKIAVFPQDKTADVPEIAEFKEGSILIRPLKSQGRQRG